MLNAKEEKVKKLIKSVEKIQSFFRSEKERNKLFTLKPNKVWNTKSSYYLINKLPTGKVQMDVFSQTPLKLDFNDIVEAFQYYKVDKYLLEKINEIGKGYKLNIGFNIVKAVRTKNENKLNQMEKKYEYKYNDIGKLVKSTMIFNKMDVYTYLEEVYNEYKKLLSGYGVEYIAAIKNISIDIYKTKPLNGKSYIPLPEWIANKSQLLISRMKITIALFIPFYVEF